mgnify:CR=1 FL=1
MRLLNDLVRFLDIASEGLVESIRRFDIYAIVESGSKQYKVSPGQTVLVERLEVSEGQEVTLDRVLLVADGQSATVGTPLVKGARVLATAAGEALGEKIVVMKYKAKVRYHHKTGHRQLYTKLTIQKIITEGEGQGNGS